MDRGKMPSSGRGGKSKAPQHPQDIFALGSKSTVVVSRDAEKRNIHKPSSSGVDRKREATTFGGPPPSKRSRIGSPAAETVGGTSLEVDPVDLVPHVLQALDTHNSDKLLGLLTGSIRLLKSQRSKPDPILCMSMLYLTKIRPNMFSHETVTQSLCTLLKREQGAAFKSKGNPLVFVLACNMLYAGHRESKNWPDTFIKVYIEDALNERWWVECAWSKCLVENIVTAFSTRHPPRHLIPTDTTLGTMSPSGSGSPLTGSGEDDIDNSELEYSVFPRYSTSYEAVEGLVLESIKEQIQRRAAPDAIGKGFLKLLSATCGFPEIRMISASRLEAWLHSGKLWRAAQELLAYVCCNADASGATAARDHEVLAQLARMRLKTKPLVTAYIACLREMVSESPALLRSVVTHTIYNELSNVRSPNNMAVLSALIQAQPQAVPQAMADTYLELLLRPEDYIRSLRALTRECVRAGRADAAALLPLARGLAMPPPIDPPAEIRERAFASIADLFALCCLVVASHSKHNAELKQLICGVQACAAGWLLETAPLYRAAQPDYRAQLLKIMFVESAEAYSKADNWPAEAERALLLRVCCEAPLPQATLLRIIFIGLAKEIPISPAEVLELVEQLVRRACALAPEDCPLQVDKLEIADYIFQLCQFHPPDNIALPAGYTPPPLAITSLYWRGWAILVMLAAHNPAGFAQRAYTAYPTLRALIETCITNKPSLEWAESTPAEAEAERAAILQLESHLAAASSKLPVTEHNARLPSQLTTLDPHGPARRPPPAVLESFQQLSSSLRLGRLLCRQPALLLQLTRQHGTRRAMPWLHRLLRHDKLELSVLPVQCLCEFLSAGGASGAGEASKVSELAAHLRRTVAESAEGARAVLQYYTQRLAHAHHTSRANAHRGLKLVLTQTTEETTEQEYNAEVGPDSWLPLLWQQPHWAGVRGEVVSRVRAACLVECVPHHVAAYVAFLARHVAAAPAQDHTPLFLDLSQLIMERLTVTANILPPCEMPETAPWSDEPPLGPHRTLHALTSVCYQFMQQVRSPAGLPPPAAEPEPEEGSEEAEEYTAWSGRVERVALQWRGAAAELPLLLAHAQLKLLCFGPSHYDTNNTMYNYLLSTWIGDDAPQLFSIESGEEVPLLPDWLRLHLVRSARPVLLEAGLKQLPAHKLALFIQTFGMPVAAMSALLSALDACPAGAVLRLGVERPYMTQLLRVQRARGARGGDAFASALALSPPSYPPEDTSFDIPTLPEEMEGSWGAAPAQPPLLIDDVVPLLDTAFCGARSYAGDTDTAVTRLVAKITQEAKASSRPFTGCVTSHFTRHLIGSQQLAAAFLRRAAVSAHIFRALSAHTSNRVVYEISEILLKQCKGAVSPIIGILHEISHAAAASGVAGAAGGGARRGGARLPPGASEDQLLAALEAATPITLEEVGNRMIETQDARRVVRAITRALERSQAGAYDVQIKSEPGSSVAEAPATLSRRGLGAGLLLDWLCELQQETRSHGQMRLMFSAGPARWRPLSVALLAHRASWSTLHNCLTTLLQNTDEWEPTAVLNFAETLTRSGRLWQGRDKTTPKHHEPEDTLRLTHDQLSVLVSYIIAEAATAIKLEGPTGGVQRITRRMPLLLQCCSSPAALLCCALCALEDGEQHVAAGKERRDAAEALLLLLHMQVPKIQKLLAECEQRPTSVTIAASPDVEAAAARCPSAADRVAHSLLTALAAQAHAATKLWRIESGVRSLWSRGGGAAARALRLVAALLRGAPPRAPALPQLLAAVEMLPDHTLFHDQHSKELNDIVECFMSIAAGGASRDASSSLMHRVAALLRRYAACRPARAQAALARHRDTVASVSALSSLASPGGEAAPSSAAPPPRALAALQRRRDNIDELHADLQELESWGTRRGGAWGGAGPARALLRAAAPLCAAPHAQLRNAAFSLLVKLLPAVDDTEPALAALLQCLDSPQPEVVGAALERLGELLCGMQHHAAVVLMKVFELGTKGAYPVDGALAKTLSFINLHRGC